MRSLFFCPVFNQREELPGLLSELRAAPLACSELLLVNNGSSDGSEALVRASGFPYLDVPRNLGIGHSFQLACDYALARGFDVFGSIAGNGKMDPAQMPRVLDPIREGRADYVTGSRFLAGGASPNLPAFRQRAIPAVNVYVRLLTGAALTDATCGYRAFRTDLLRRARFDWHAPWLRTYGFEYYLYAQVVLSPGVRYLEVPVTMRYPPAGRPYSKIRPGRDWWAMLQPWMRARLDRKGFAPAPPLTP